MNYKKLEIRCWRSGDDEIVNTWNDLFVLKDGLAGAKCDIPDVYQDGQHFVVFDEETAVGSFAIIKDRTDVTTILIGIGHPSYRNKECLCAICDRVKAYMEDCYSESRLLLLFDQRLVADVLVKPLNECDEYLIGEEVSHG